MSTDSGCRSFASRLRELPRSRGLEKKCLLHPFLAALDSGRLSSESFDSFEVESAKWSPAAEATQEGGGGGGCGDTARSLAQQAAAARLRLRLAEALDSAGGSGGAGGADFGGASEGDTSGRRWVRSVLASGAEEQVSKLEADLHRAAEASLASAAASDDPGAARSQLLESLESAYFEALEGCLAVLDGLPSGIDVSAGVARADAAGDQSRLLRVARIMPPRVLIIAGSDSGGGAGIQADLKACSALGAFGMTAIAALTAQNSKGVQGIFPIPLDFIVQQMRSVLDDLGADVVKTGMLATAEVVSGVAAALRQGRDDKGFAALPQLVVDPVMVSTSGHKLLQDDAIETVKAELLPMATLITPNLPEAQELLKREVADAAAMEAAARDLCALGPRWVLVKGGHLCREKGGSPSASGPLALDVLCDSRTGKCERFESRMIETTHTHGTGCTLASSIAALLAAGRSVPEAVREAKAYVAGSIAASAHLPLGAGPQGPLNHAWQTAQW